MREQFINPAGALDEQACHNIAEAGVKGHDGMSASGPCLNS